MFDVDWKFEEMGSTSVYASVDEFSLSPFAPFARWECSARELIVTEPNPLRRSEGVFRCALF